MNELVAAADLMRKGYHVFRALSPSCPCDLIIYHGEDPERVVRVEVRTARRNASGDVQRKHSPHERHRYDIKAFVQHDGTVLYDPDLPS